ncbi:MAG TPA: GSCFA domain-containing protein [Chryseosolibacter sp.]
MKDFRTEIKITPSSLPITRGSRILTQGSCFADAIGARLSIHKINTLVNPFGVIYNPDSIHKVLEYAIFNESLPEHTFIRNQDLYLNFNFHSEFSALSKEQLVSRLMNTIGATHYFLKDAGLLLLTYGTAWVYHRKETGEVVANCHKVPSSMFTKSLLSAESVCDSFRRFYTSLKKFNDKIKIILTVSPVRHLRDTLELNAVSKAVLRIACHAISNKYDDVEYFPAFEMMTDDLRDYRFYKADMIHPTPEAEDYIWEKFMERYFNPDLRDFVRKWSEVLSALRHKPFHPQSASHQQFLKETLLKLQELRPLADVEEEIRQVRQQMIISPT